jgi:hypothetical protein
MAAAQTIGTLGIEEGINVQAPGIG